MGSGVGTRPRAQPQPPPRTRLKERPRIVFICIGNSCRSPMAEGWARHLGKGEVEAASAGLYPLGHIAQETIQVMKEKNVSLAGQTSKGLEDINWQEVDVLVNMTRLPAPAVVPGFRGATHNWNIPDPYGESLPTYRKVRDLLEQKVEQLLAELSSSSPSGTGSPSVV